MTQLTDNTETIRRFIDEFLNEGNLELAEEFLDADVVDHTPFGDTKGRDAFVETTKMMESIFPDLVITPEEIIADGDTVAVRMTQRGTHEGTFMGIEPTGRSFEIQAMAFGRMKDGKLVERRAHPDLLGLLQQLGQTELPAQAA